MRSPDPKGSSSFFAYSLKMPQLLLGEVGEFYPYKTLREEIICEMSYILKVKNVCKSFGDLKAVDNLSFEVEEGQIFGIAGPNGAGKTTLFNSITGIPLKPDSGEIYFKGIPVHPLPAHKIYYLGIARTFQMETVFESLTVFENVMIANIYGKKSKVKRNNEELVYRVLGMVGLNDKDILHKQARHLPLFDKKKLILASALVTKPKIIFLDQTV